jgi:prepilin signal peptidase PulO-like enzyme (type II secretory pathway)
MGPKATLSTLFFAVFQASIIGIGMIIFNRQVTVPYDDVEDDDPIKDKAALPFVPFLVLGALEYLFFGERLITLYLNFMRGIVG